MKLDNRSAVDRFVAMLAKAIRLKSEHEQFGILRDGRRLLAERRAKKADR